MVIYLLSTIPGLLAFGFLVWGVVHNGSPIVKQPPRPYTWPVRFFKVQPKRHTENGGW